MGSLVDTLPLGVDVNHWHKVGIASSLPPNLAFFGAKATEGETNCDPTFDAHRALAREMALPTIYYHVAALGDPKRQAKRFMATCGPLVAGELLALDVEQDTARLLSVSWVNAFYEALFANPSIVRALIYISASGWASLSGQSSEFEYGGDVGLWAPRYASQPPVPAAPWAKRGWRLWQFTEGYLTPGVLGGTCDASVFNGTQSELIDYFGAEREPQCAA